MSREEPKFCTCGSWNPAGGELRAHVVDIGGAREADFGAHTAREVDAQIQPAGEERRERDDHEHADSAYHTLRVAMNG